MSDKRSIVRLTMGIVGSGDEAKAEAERRLLGKLHEWFAGELGGATQPPWPDGELLHWNFTVEERAR